MNFIRRWLAERRFDREHRPYLYTDYLPGSSFMGVYCRKHGGQISECPEDAKGKAKKVPA